MVPPWPWNANTTGAGALLADAGAITSASRVSLPTFHSRRFGSSAARDFPAKHTTAAMAMAAARITADSPRQTAGRPAPTRGRKRSPAAGVVAFPPAGDGKAVLPPAQTPAGAPASESQ